MKFLRIAKSQIEQGIEVEKEHKDVYDEISEILGDKMPWTLDEFAEKIAKAHLKEMDDYYTRLKKMESNKEKK